MSSHYVLKGQIIHLEHKLSEMREHQASILKGLTIFRWVTLLLYLAFTLSLYVGDVMNIKTLFDSFVGSFIGFALYLMIAIGLAYSLASFKHNFYVYRGIHGGAMPMVFVVILMGLTAEIFQSSGQQDVKARAGAAASQQYQTMLQQSPNVALSQGYADPYADKLIKLEGELAKTQELERTCVKTCSAQRQKVEALQGQIAAVQQLQQQSASKHSSDLTNAQNLYSQQLNAVEEKHYNPTIRSVKEMTGVGIGTAISIIMGIISIIFEVCHGYFSAMYNRTLRSIEDLNQRIVALRGQYAHLTGNELNTNPVPTPKPTQPDPNSQSTSGQVNQPTVNLTGLSGAVSAFAPNLTGKHSPTLSIPTKGVLEKVAGELNQAQQVRDQIHAGMAAKADQISAAWADATSYPSTKTSTYAKELADAGIPSPHDPVLDQAADQESIRRIINRAKPDLNTPLPTQNLTDNLTGQVKNQAVEAGQVAGQVSDQVDRNAEKLAKAQAEIEAMKAEKVRLEAEAVKLRQARETAEKAAREAAEQAARLAQERAAKEAQQRAEAEAKARAERQVRLEEQRKAEAEAAARKVAEQQRAEAEARAKAAQAAREAAEQQARLEHERAEAETKAQAERDAERGNLTEEQVNQAAQVIKQLIQNGQVSRLGFNSLKEHLIAAELPATSDSIRRLIKLGCQQLIAEGIVRNNPNAGTGKPDFLIV